MTVFGIALAACLVLAFARGASGSASEAILGCFALASVAVAFALLLRVRFRQSWRRR